MTGKNNTMVAGVINRGVSYQSKNERREFSTGVRIRSKYVKELKQLVFGDVITRLQSDIEILEREVHNRLAGGRPSPEFGSISLLVYLEHYKKGLDYFNRLCFAKGFEGSVSVSEVMKDLVTRAGQLKEVLKFLDKRYGSLELKQSETADILPLAE